jgi:hypothetical protein
VKNPKCKNAFFLTTSTIVKKLHMKKQFLTSTSVKKPQVKKTVFNPPPPPHKCEMPSGENSSFTPHKCEKAQVKNGCFTTTLTSVESSR